MIKIVTFIVIITIAVCGFWFWQDCIEEEKREQKYQQEIEECNRKIEEYRRLYELLNYNGDDWIIKWEDYMMEYSSYRYYPV